MTCLCLPRLQALVSAVAPLATLPAPALSVPSVMASLAAALPAAATPAAAGLDLRALLALSLPPLPLPQPVLLQVTALAHAVSQLSIGLGLDLFAPGGASRLTLALRTAQARLPALVWPAGMAAATPALLSLSMALATIARCRASLGVDLLAPGAAFSLKAALAIPPAPAPPLPPALALRLSAYADLAAASSAFGGPARLLPALQALVSLAGSLPMWNAALSAPLAQLSLMVGVRLQLGTVLGLDLAAPDLAARLTALLRPLWALPPMLLQGLNTPPAAPVFDARFATQAKALATLPLAGIAALKLPPLAPAALLGSVAGAGELASADCC